MTLFDTARYPIHDPAAPRYRALVGRCRADLAATGNCLLPGFVPAATIARCIDECDAVVDRTYRAPALQNVYYTPEDTSLAADDPRRRMFRRSSGFIPGDAIGPDTALRRIFEDDTLLAFLQDCRGEGPLYRFADPLGDMVVNVLDPGQTLPWHFDTPDFSVTLMVQAAEAGGAFDYAARIRSPEAENFDAVRRVLDGMSDEVRSLDPQPGDLQLFHGRHSLHRVAPTQGTLRRYTAVLGYVDEPGLVARPERAMQLYGRTDPAHHARDAEDGLLD